MKYCVIKIFILCSIMIWESKQEEPSVNCQRDQRLLFTSERYYMGLKLKCSFANINSIDDFKNVQSASSTNGQNIASISFNNSNLSEFPERMFSNYQYLKSLDGSNLKLGSLSSGSFSSLVTMDSVDLSFNLLTTLTAKVFANKKIKNLNLSNNQIVSIEESSFSGSEVDNLNLAFNKIIDMGFVNTLKSFNVLKINNNLIEKFDSLKLSKESWSTTGDLIGTTYPTINLMNNKLKSFDCKSTLKFEMIELKNNENLNTLDTSECAIILLDVSDCVNLKSVKLGDNIEGFTAKNVKFDQIDFSRSKYLDTLKLLNNSLKSETLSDIMKLENLTSLDLSYNVIGPLNVSTFAKLKKLSSLKLKSTNISNVQFGTFSHQNGVRVLDISDNKLGSFDMQMIFSMTSLTYLDLSGNNLIELSNIDAAHNTFAMLEKIDLTNNKWTCNYLMRLIKIMRAYRVALVHAYIEEHQSNINGIYCRHIAGEDNVIEPLSPNSSNVSDIRDKMNEIVNDLTKGNQIRIDILSRLSTLESRVSHQPAPIAPSEALRSVQTIKVQNGMLFEFTLMIALCCIIVIVLMKIIVFFKRNFMSQPRSMRVGLSEHTLVMNAEEL